MDKISFIEYMKSQLIIWLPFIGAIHDRRNGRPMLSKIAEHIIISALAAALAIYVNDKLQDNDIKQLRSEIQDVKTMISQMRTDLYVPRTHRQ